MVINENEIASLKKEKASNVSNCSLDISSNVWNI